MVKSLFAAILLMCAAALLISGLVLGAWQPMAGGIAIVLWLIHGI